MKIILINTSDRYIIEDIFKKPHKLEVYMCLLLESHKKEWTFQLKMTHCICQLPQPTKRSIFSMALWI